MIAGAVLTAPADAVERPFSPSSFWNTALSADAPIDPSSSTWVAEIGRQVRWGTYVNTTSYSAPVYTVDDEQATVPVRIDKTGTGADALRESFAAVPLPEDARPAAGTDGHLVVWQSGTDTMWEFFALSRDAEGWRARWGGTMRNASTNPGYFSDPSTPWWLDPERSWGATATGLPLLGGLIRMDELRDGAIDHALALALPEAKFRQYSWPAQRTDGRRSSSTAIPEGARFRLDPDLDIAALGLPRPTRIIAEAAQRYGVVVRDTSQSAVVMAAEDPTPTGANPYPELFSGLRAYDVLRQFPWSRLQALQGDVDKSAPETSITEGPPPITGSATATFAYTSPEPNVLFQCGMDGQRFRNCDDRKTFDGLAEGDHTFWAQAVDRSDNYRPEVFRTFRVDTIFPRTTVTSGPPGVTTSTKANIAFKTSEPGTSTQCQLDGGWWSSCRSIWSYGYLRLGGHNVRVRAIDRAGNVEASPPTHAWQVTSP